MSDRPMTTREVAEYLRYRTLGAVRKAKKEGRLVALGRRGGGGCLLFSREEVERFARGEPRSTLGSERSSAPLERGNHEQEAQTHHHR